MKRAWILIIALSIVSSCGAPQETEPTPVPPAQPLPGPTPGPTPTPGGKPAFAEMQTLMQKYCVECHAAAGFTKSEAALIGSSSRQRVQNATMPPPYALQMTPADKARFSSFF